MLKAKGKIWFVMFGKRMVKTFFEAKKEDRTIFMPLEIFYL
jgi:hypothetical protein